MADYAGAVAAMRARFVAQWKVGSARRTPIAFQNETPSDDNGDAISPWPPVTVDPNDATKKIPTPWVYFEIIGNTSSLRGAGKPGDQLWSYLGHIFIHVFVPEGYGVGDAHQLAVDAGEIFRNAQFYTDGQGRGVRTGIGPDGEAIHTEGGGSDADNGNWFRVSTYVPFEYFHRG